MKYEKPEVLPYSAIAVIQETGPVIKVSDPVHDGFRPTDPAYQADE